MRINQFVARATGLSRRAADAAISDGRVRIGERIAQLGDQVSPEDVVKLDDATLQLTADRTIMLYKPVGYVTSRRQQGPTSTIYALLPEELRALKPVGRLDRDTSGLLLLTSDGELAQQLQHPSSGKMKRYLVWLDRALGEAEIQKVRDGIRLEDGISHMELQTQGNHYRVALQEGRNRQIRRSFAALGRRVTKLHRTDFGPYSLGDMKSGSWRDVAPVGVS